jgi:ABC-type branched-subunit amino acid transport system substrate-binding protein
MSGDAHASSKHELLLELGRGGVGVVHLARRDDGRLVVRKSLRPELARNVAVRRMFLEEARVAQQVRHPNVVEVIATGFDAGGVPWIEMEWGPGATLQALEDTAPLPFDLFVRVVADLLSGLHAAHVARGADGAPLELVHRDVSPHNVLVTYDGEVKVLDFGIAKVKGSHVDTTTGVVKGKATYLAPEQASRRAVDARADLFAVGVILWQKLAGRRIWEGMSEPEIFHRLVTGQIPDLLELAPDTPEPLARVVRDALAREPGDRAATAEAMRDALLAAAPPREGAREAIARHVRETFADERRDVMTRIEGGGALAVTTSAAQAESTGSIPGASTARARRRRAPLAWAAFAVALAGGALATFAARRGPPPATTAAMPSAASVAPQCATDDACPAGHRCDDDGACVAIARDGCTVVPEGLPRSGRVLYLGVMLPLSGPDADAYGRSNARAAELAAREVDRLAGGVPSGDGRRLLGLLLCDDAVDAEARARHLADRVPAIVGFRTSDEALTLTRDLFVPRGVLAVSALNSSPLLAQLPAGEPRLLFRSAASATAFVAPMARAVATMLAPDARRRSRLGGAERVRVSVVRSGDATGIAYADGFLRELGQPADLDVKETALGVASDAAARAAAIDTLARWRPHVVVMPGDGMFASVVKPLEDRLGGAEAQRPIYLATTPWEDDGLRAFVGARPERRRRFFAVSWPTASRALMGFVERYAESFGERLSPATASPGPYDSVYLLAYAAAALHGERVTGAALSRGIERLLPGAPAVEVGPSQVVAGLAAVARGERVDLGGVVSRFDFDLATGDSPVEAVLLCTTYDATRNHVDASDIAIEPGAVVCR